MDGVMDVKEEEQKRMNMSIRNDRLIPPLATAIRCSGRRQITSYPDNLRHIDTQESTSGTANLDLSTIRSLSG